MRETRLFSKNDIMMRDNYRIFSSATIAGSGNQFFFSLGEKKHGLGRIFYKISVEGTHKYSLLFSNVIDTTYADGKQSHADLKCGEWMLHAAKVGVCDKADADADIEMTQLTFGGMTDKLVGVGDEFWSDAVTLTFKKGQYLCFEAEYSGEMIPYHEETILPCFVFEDGKWSEGRKIPFPSMIGCDRPISKRIAFFGDSITQGIGTEIDSYDHWCAVLSDMLDGSNAYWNLGLGYARAEDAALDGAWLKKAKRNDIVFVCLGTNDVFHVADKERLISSLGKIVDKLNDVGIEVILITLPPFDQHGMFIDIWNSANEFIKTTLSKKVKTVFDVVPVLCGDEPWEAKYGGHPNAEGCKKWAMALFEHLKNI